MERSRRRRQATGSAVTTTTKRTDQPTVGEPPATGDQAQPTVEAPASAQSSGGPTPTVEATGDAHASASHPPTERSAADPADSSGHPEAPGSAEPARPPLRRRTDGRLIAGVAGGVADHLGLSALVVRLAFVVLTAFNGFGLVAYLALWIFVPQARPGEPESPAGIAAATRAGRRTVVRRRPREDFGQFVALGALALGLLFLGQASSLGVNPSIFWPAIFVLGGVAIIWLQVDSSERQRAATSTEPTNRRRSRWRTSGMIVLRVLAGTTLIGIGFGAFLAAEGGYQLAIEGLFGALVLIAGLAVIAGPWLLRLWRELAEERRERILSQERADVAAHLHDSVLQTLALIQKKSDDPRAVVQLARRQERDLRAWLYASTSQADESFKAALTRVAAETEDAHGVPVEVVVVGDTMLDEPLTAMLSAAREAITNAAKHSGADRIDVYAEVEPTEVEMFVRDRGRGWDPTDIPTDRHGVRHSIIDRMERYGGKAEIRSAPGNGTEVRLRLRRAE
jgi:signal transduction histidine kinase/phage shock protein PspC (stress-responsive transcriptional regulator)